MMLQKSLLQNITTKDSANDKIQESLLNASNLGQELEEMLQFVRDQEEYAWPDHE